MIMILVKLKLCSYLIKSSLILLQPSYSKKYSKKYLLDLLPNNPEDGTRPDTAGLEDITVSDLEDIEVDDDNVEHSEVSLLPHSTFSFMFLKHLLLNVCCTFYFRFQLTMLLFQ